MAHTVNSSLGTGLDVADISEGITDGDPPGFQHDLSDTELKFLFELSKTQSNLLEEFTDAIKPIEEALEMTASILIRKQFLELIFK